MAFDFNNLQDNGNTITEVEKDILRMVTNRDNDIEESDYGIERHEVLMSKGCFSSKKGFYDYVYVHIEEYYIEDPKYYLEIDGRPKPEAANFTIVYLEPDREDISKPIVLYIDDKELEYPALVFQQLNEVTTKQGDKLEGPCYVFLGIFKIEKADKNSGFQKYRLLKIGDTFYFDSSKKN